MWEYITLIQTQFWSESKSVELEIEPNSTQPIKFGPFQFVWSNSVHFGTLWSIQSTSVQYGPFSSLWSNSVYLVQFSPVCYILVHFGLFGHFGPFGPLWYILVHFGLLDPIWSVGSLPLSKDMRSLTVQSKLDILTVQFEKEMEGDKRLVIVH